MNITKIFIIEIIKQVKEIITILVNIFDIIFLSSFTL